MDAADLGIAMNMERQMLNGKYPFTCGCVVEMSYRHCTRMDWVLIKKYVSACQQHRHMPESLKQERAQDWRAGDSVPKWRDSDGDWINRKDWNASLFAVAGGSKHGVFWKSEGYYLLLVGQSCLPVRSEFTEIICLNLQTGKPAYKQVPEPVLRYFGWHKQG